MIFFTPVDKCVKICFSNERLINCIAFLDIFAKVANKSVTTTLKHQKCGAHPWFNT